MPHAPVTPTRTADVDTAPEPVVHLTRRERIAAERRAAAAGDPVAAPVRAEVATPVTPPAPASPIDLAPASPVRPEPSAGAVTPPAPSSPVVAPAAVRRAGRAARPVVTTADRATRHIPAVPAAPAAATASTGSSFRRTASRITAVGALLFAAGLVVSTSLPAQALWVPTSTTAERTGSGAAQTLAVGDGATDAETTRDQYSVSSAAQYKNVDASSFTNDANGTIQWPFLTGVPITSGFGGRQVEGCSFCSTNHMGVDFAPGEGTPIRVIADGVVTKVQANDGGFGNDVWVTHDVDGKQFVSVYGHMKDGTFKVVTGQEVAVGDELGEVGSTGNSTGPHLHLEIHVGGVPVDPLAWLRANAN
ncbi:M23 family metallopeptidase [uncultured Curtobacterium sp.]|uniref:M23 family metallopeptidase n=1 Tax=uncultured Curtobacterium sp. TaxID=331964 RepID=UPI00258E2ADD|nr:peptidoglycan DD-metalloendopeptidase family protein [uncultured Curtobacterium sp.]